MNNNGISIYKISEISYYSKSSIYKSIEKLNRKLKPLGISCRTSGLIGDEKKIRHFVFESYWTLFGGIEWPFKVKREEILSEIKSLEMNGIYFNGLDKEKVLYWIAITEMRLTMGNSIHGKGNEAFELNKKKLFHSFFLKYCWKYEEKINFKEESRFLLNTIHFLGSSSLKLKGDGEQTKAINKIENYLRLKGEKAKLNLNEMIQLQVELFKINYYRKENLFDWYNFLEPNAKTYFREVFILMEEKWLVLQNDICEDLSSMYMLMAKNNGICLLNPIRMYIVSKEGKTAEISQFIKKYSTYPIEITQSREIEVDTVLTDFFMDNQEKKLKSNLIFFEWPLTEYQVINIVNTAINIKKFKLIMNGRSNN